jgi:hypothetical protein
MSKESWYAGGKPEDITRIDISDNFIVDYDKSRGMYRVSVFDDGHFWDEFWFDAYEEREVGVNKQELIDWLLGEKYIYVDENSTEMTDEFEKQHKWELSRNCFINKVIKHLTELE